MKFYVFSLFTFLCVNFTLYSQDVTDLDLKPGYGGIFIGNYYEDVKMYLLKDSIPKKAVWDTTDSRVQSAERVFLADLSQPDLDTFWGRKVERVEVYTSQRHNNSIEDPNDHRQVVDYIKIYLKQEHYDDGAFQDLVGYFYVDYGNYMSEEYNAPQEGDMRYSWSGKYLAFRLSNYYGEIPLNRKFDLAIYYRGYE